MTAPRTKRSYTDIEILLLNQIKINVIDKFLFLTNFKQSKMKNFLFSFRYTALHKFLFTGLKSMFEIF